LDLDYGKIVAASIGYTTDD